jgi:hypothetical protein
MYTAVEIRGGESRTGGCSRAGSRCRCCCPAACMSVLQERGEEAAMPADGSCLRSSGTQSRPAPPASPAVRATASPGPSSPACPSSRPRSSPLAWSMIALRSCRGLRRSASGWAGPQAEGCYVEIRRGAGPVQVHAAGMTASRGRDVMETLGVGPGGEGLAAERPGRSAQAATVEEGEPDGRPKGKG